MPGIVGIVGKGPAKQHEQALQHMVGTMLHDQSYTSGTYTNQRLGAFIGWAQHPGSFSDCMPLWNNAKDLCLVLSGEHFSESALRNGKIPNAHFVMDLFEQKGSSALKDLNGWFSGVLIDLRNSTALLFNDRYGMHRLYLHEAKEALYFSSEAKALLRVRPELRALNMKSLGESFSFGCVLQNRTIFSNITLLPPGSAWTIHRGSVNKKTYFSPSEWERQPQLDKEELYARLRETFVTILPNYFKTNDRIGMSLTGGLDTRMILAGKQILPGELPCYTFGGMYRECYDVKIARKIAALCGQTHKVLPVDQTFLSQFPALAEKTVYFSDGNMDVSGAADLYVNQLAKEIAPVRLTGNYGSEILRGSVHLKARQAMPGLFDRGFEQEINGAADTLAAEKKTHRVSFAAFKQTPWFHYNRLVVEQSQLTMRSPFLDNGIVKLMYQAPTEVLDSSEISFRLIKEGNPRLAAILTDFGLGPDNTFVSALAKRYRTFTFKADYACNYGQPQWMAAFESHMPRALRMENFFLGRHKFHHFRIWFRDELAGYVKEIMLDKRSMNRPYLNGKMAEKIVRDHTEGRLNYTTDITKLLTVELLQRMLIEGTNA